MQIQYKLVQQTGSSFANGAGRMLLSQNDLETCVLHLHMRNYGLSPSKNIHIYICMYLMNNSNVFVSPLIQTHIIDGKLVHD